jgi:predicted GH43/DUF377 family glycosyl hydrolase
MITRLATSILALILCGIPGLGISSAYLEEASPSWLSPDWQYREKKTIQGSADGVLTDYQLSGLTLHYGAGNDGDYDLYLDNQAQIDFDDIRFTAEDGVTLLNYWIEEKVDSEYAKVVVKIPCILVDGTTVYIYYGNDKASSGSNADGTFEFFSAPDIPNYGIRESTNPVLSVSQAGGYDDEDVFSPCVLKAGDVYYMYYVGEHNAGGAEDYTIALATSPDGVTWTKVTDPQPVLAKGVPGAWDDAKLLFPCVVKDGDTWHMWYVGKHDGDNGSVLAIGHATAPDGLHWTKDSANPVIERTGTGWEANSVGTCWVIKDGDTWKMWYAGQDASGKCRIGYATTSNPDGANWTRWAGNPIFERDSTDNWDADDVHDMYVLKIAENDWRMWFHGQDDGWGGTQEIGIAESSDGIHWTEIEDNPVYYGSANGGDGSGDWECAGVGYRFCVLKVGDEYWAWYSAHTDHGVNAGYPDTAQIGLLKNVLIDQPSDPEWVKNRGLGGGGPPFHSLSLDFDNENKQIVEAERRGSDTNIFGQIFRWITGTGQDADTDFIRDGTDIGTQHHAIWTLTDSFILEWKSTIHTSVADQIGQGGIAVIADDDTIILYGGHFDDEGGAIAPKRLFAVESGWSGRWEEDADDLDQCNFKIVRDGDSLKGYVDNVLIVDITTKSTVSKIALVAGGYGGHDYLDYVQIEDVRVRKYTPAEPSWGLKDEEEQIPVVPNPGTLGNILGIGSLIVASMSALIIILRRNSRKAILYAVLVAAIGIMLFFVASWLW